MADKMNRRTRTALARWAADNLPAPARRAPAADDGTRLLAELGRADAAYKAAARAALKAAARPAALKAARAALKAAAAAYEAARAAYADWAA